MKTKTETECYNEDDFIQHDGQLHELTVTITPRVKDQAALRHKKTKAGDKGNKESGESL